MTLAAASVRVPQVKLYRTLPFQVMFVTAAVLVTGLVLLGVRLGSEQLAAADASARQHALTIARSLAGVSASHLMVDDYASLERALLDIAEYPNVKHLLVLDHGGQVVSEVINEQGRALVVYGQTSVAPPLETSETAVRIDGAVLVVWEPVLNGARLGWVNVRYGLDELDEVRERMVVGTASAVLIAIVLCIGVLWLYLRRPLRAIHDTTRYASRLDDADTSALAADSGVAELDTLQRSLNAAAVELRARRDALTDSSEMLRLILNYAADSIISIAPDGTIQAFNRSAEQTFGYPVGEVIGKNVSILMPEPHRAAHDGYIRRYLASGEGKILGRLREVTGRRKDGSTFPMELAVSEVRTHDRHLIVGVVRDISDRKRAEEMSSRLGRILEHSSNEIYIFDAATLRLLQCSRGAAANLGYAPDELARLMLPQIQPNVSRAQFDEFAVALHAGAQNLICYETAFRRKDGTSYTVEVRLQLSRAEESAVYVAIVQDITDRKRSEQQLHFLANYDTLTGLPNRAQLQKRMEQAMADAHRAGRLLATMFVDLDRFKLVNDTMGHEAGDELLRVIARRIVETLRPGDTVARLGGDEFVVLMANVAEPADIDKMAERLLQRLGVPVRIGGRELYVTPSIGVSVFPEDARDAEELLKNADAAMYLAKENGRNCFRFFTPDLNARAARRLALETSLRRALEQGEFVLHYQPQVHAASGEVTGAEALVRWRHPELGLIPPNEFIPLAEDTGLIVPLGRWVLETAARDARRWRTNGFPRVRVAVNISGRQLARDTLVRTVLDVLQQTGLEPGGLDLELTESLLMQNLDETAALLGELAELGVTVSMDDFGTGYSSLSYLKRLPIHALKIDRAFVRDITSDTDAGAIVSAIIVMARGLRINVVAEGVESHEQYEYLRLGLCSEMQGYFFSRPVPVDDFIELLRATDGRFAVPDYGGLKVVK